MGFEQELKIVTRAYNQAQQGLQSTAQGIENVAKSALNAAAASAKLNQAFGQAVAQAEGFKRASTGLYLPLDRVADAEARVAKQSHEMGQATDRAGQHMHGMGGDAGHARDAMQELYMTLGMLGFLYGFQQAVTNIIGVTREFGKEIAQASIISEDFTGSLQRQAMAATQGIFGPKELADVYRDLGSAGLNANQVLAATPDVLNFATAAMVEQSDAAQAVIAAASSFRIPFEQADKITDAFAEAMNRTTLGGRDLVYALASIGPVAGMAGQGLGETLAAVAALRNAGAHAQDAATSVRAAMLHLSAPSQEAADLIKQLKLEIFDASGNMKQWSQIVAEFERALAPYNQQAKNMILTTVMGSDGIRAMASAMQMGSGNLADLAASFESAHGSAARMASQMSETVDGAMRRFAGNTERASIVIGQDLTPALTSLLGFLNTLAVGMANLDAGTRHLVEGFIGGAGLLGAGMSVVGMAKMLFNALNGLGPVLNAMQVAAGATALTLGGVLGIAGALALAIGVGYGAWKAYQAGQEQAALAGTDQAEQLRNQADRVKSLTDELQRLEAKTSPTTAEQERLKQVTQEIAKLAPEAALGINQITGQVIDLGKVLQGTNDAMERMMGQSKALATAAASAATARLPSLRTEADELERKVAWQQGQIAAGILPMRSLGGKFAAVPLSQAERDAARKKQGDELLSLISELAKKRQEIAETEATFARATMLGMGITDDPAERLREQNRVKHWSGESVTFPGGKSLGGGDKPPSWMDQWKSWLTETTDRLTPYKTALSGVSGELDILSAKESMYLDMLKRGKGGVELVSLAEKARTGTIDGLKSHQDALHKSNEAYRGALVTLHNEQARLDGLLAAGTITAKDHADATHALKAEQERLTQSIQQNSAAWWKDEQASASAADAAGEASRVFSEASYRTAAASMHHEVAMRRLSVDQQIALYRQMLREMNLANEQSWSIQESVASLYGDKIKAKADEIATAYRSSMDTISDTLETNLDGVDSRLKATLTPLKQQLEELEGQKRGDDRDRATVDHNKKLTDLQKQRHYHELRQGQEHQKALADLDGQIAEENLRWQRQQDDWQLDDKKRGLEDQVKAAEDGAKDERDKLEKEAKQRRKDLEKHYAEVKRIAENGIFETIAALAVTDPKWFETGKTLIQRLIDGLQTGDFSTALGLIDSVRLAAENAAAAVSNLAKTGTGTSGYVPPDHGTPAGTGKGPLLKATPYASGAWEIPDTQIALLHPKESVLPAYAATAFRNFAPAVSNLDRVIEGAVDRLIKVFQALPLGPVTVYGAQNAYFEDPVDSDLLSRQIGRQVARLTLTGGRSQWTI